MNVRDIVIAPNQKAIFSTTMRTGIFKDGQATKHEPGAYRFRYVTCNIFGECVLAIKQYSVNVRRF